MGEAKTRLDNLTKPIGSLGRLEDLARQIAGITGTLNPDFTKKLDYCNGSGPWSC